MKATAQARRFQHIADLTGGASAAECRDVAAQIGQRVLRQLHAGDGCVGNAARQCKSHSAGSRAEVEDAGRRHVPERFLCRLHQRQGVLAGNQHAFSDIQRHTVKFPLPQKVLQGFLQAAADERFVSLPLSGGDRLTAPDGQLGAAADAEHRGKEAEGVKGRTVESCL